MSIAIELLGSVNQAFRIGSTSAWIIACEPGWADGDDLKFNVRLPFVVKNTLEPKTVSMTAPGEWLLSVVFAGTVWFIR